MRHRFRLRTIGAACVCATLSFPGHARTEVELTLGGDALVQDNFYYQEADDQQTVAGLKIRPEVAISRTGTLANTRIAAGGTSAHYNANPEDNYFDSNARAEVDFTLGINQLRAEASTVREHDPFGSGRTEDSTLFDRKLDTWQQTGIQFGWARLGQQRGDIFTNLTFRIANKTYTSNREQTRYLDRRSQIYRGLVGIRLTQKTGVFLSARYTDYSFEEKTDSSGRSGSTTAVFGGLRWSATARTEGDIRFGLAARNSEGFDTRFWEAEVRWEPRHSHLITLNTGRRFDPSYRPDTQFFDSRTVDLSWIYFWTRRLTSRIDFNARQRDFVGSDLSDSSRHYAAKLKYEIDHGLSIYSAVRRSTRDADQNGYNYDANTLSIGFESRIN